jgi:serine phosphatase RsbU (regulator of sigma subunit)
MVLSISLLFLFIYAVARQAIVREVRQQAVGVAMAVAKAIDGDALETIHGPEDAHSDAYRRIAQLLGDIERTNPDVRYAYTMRRAAWPHADDSWDYEFIVDAPSRDADGDGIISRSEMAEPPGKLYRARHLPALQAAWNTPTSDPIPSPDPPYPDLLSGYAPIRNRRGQTVAIAGVDITAETIGRKLRLFQIALFPAWLLASLLSLVVLRLYYQQQDALRALQERCVELRRRNQILRAANLWMAEPPTPVSDMLGIARTIQDRLLPQHVAAREHISFDTFYIGCEMIGGDLYDVFDLDDDHIGMYMADVAGHGVVAAMVGGLLKSAVGAQRHYADTDALSAIMLEPWALLAELNRLLCSELPPDAFVTMIYAVYDTTRRLLCVASAGHPAPLRLNAENRRPTLLTIPAGPAIGLMPDARYEQTEKPLCVGDRLIFFSDGVVDAIDQAGRPFGLEQLSQCVAAATDMSAKGLTRAVIQALERHRGMQPLRDDCSLLIAEIR